MLSQLLIQLIKSVVVELVKYFIERPKVEVRHVETPLQKLIAKPDTAELIAKYGRVGRVY